MARERLTVTVEEAGELLGISRGHAYDLVRRGELPHLRLGRRLVVPRRPLMALINGEMAHNDVNLSETRDAR